MSKVMLHRIAAFIVDQYICCMLLFIGSFVITGDILGYGKHLGVIIPVTLFIFRDVFGRSIGKIILKLEIVDSRTGKKATLWQRLLKNITAPITVMEILIILLKKEQFRLGDKLARTETRIKK